jgi:hypothetical protein
MAILIPKDEGYENSEGNSDLHVKSFIFGKEMFFFIED